jgi:two-component system cell cycle sensor histidine kinase/response regulator CckA
MAGRLDPVREALSQVGDPMALLVGLFANAPIGLQIYRADGHCLLTNQAFREIFGSEPEPEYVLFDDPLLPGTGVLEIARRAFAGETIVMPPIWYDTPHQPLRGPGVSRRCAVSCTWLPLLDGEGRVVHVALLYRDVTAEYAAQELATAERDRLREAQGRLQALIENAPAVVLVKDLDGRHLVVSREAARAFGFDSDYATGKTTAELFGVDCGHLSVASDRLVIESRQPLQAVERLKTVRGMREFLVNRFPIFGAGDDPTALGCIAIDISERRQAQEDLRRSEARFADVFRALPMGALFSRLSDRRFIDVNDAWLRLTGWTREESIGATAVELDLWADPGRRDELFRAIAERGSVRDFAARLHSKSGSIRELLLSVDRIELGGDACLLLLAHDVTETRQLERELRQSQKMEAIGRLAGGVAHDFNNILTAIGGANSLILERFAADDDPMRRYSEQIKRSIARAATLTRQLLAFTSKQPTQPVVLDPNDAVRAIVDMLQRMIGADIEVRTELGARGRVKTDAGALEQVLLNLAVNARDAMPSGGRLTLRTVDVAGYGVSGDDVPEGAWVLIGVNDTGIGMDRATQARVFEPFFTTKAQGKGTGLGLSTAYGIVKQSGGHILVDSSPGRGADFRIYLPRQAELPVREPPAPAVVRSPVGSETVLLAEDDEAVRDFVAFVLGKLGYRVLQAGDGVEALGVAAAYGEPIHLLLSDVVMPLMDGHELARRLVEERPGLKVIHMSGYPGDSVERSGGGPVLPKPFEHEELARWIRRTLDAPA